MSKTPEQILAETKNWFEKTKNEWKNHFSGKEKNYILERSEMGEPEAIERVKNKILILIDEALLIDEELEKDWIESWKKLYEKWNGDPDYMNEDKYNKNEDFLERLLDLRNFLVEWERASHEQSQQELIDRSQNILQVVGINLDDKNVLEKAEELKKVQDDLADLGIDKSKVKETIENERNEREVKIKQLIDKCFGEKMWEKVNIKAQIEVKER